MTNPKLDAIRKALEGLNRDERLELAFLLLWGVQDHAHQVKEVDLNRHAGTAHLPVDGLDWQRTLCAEWDRRKS